MELIRTFEKLGKNDAGIAGGKGASLGEMTQAGIPVPPGFVVLTNAFERFLDEANLNQELDTIFHTVNHQEIGTVEKASERIQSLIIAAKMPEDIAQEIQVEFQRLGTTFVAVRSSATAEDGANAAWAGQLDTFLNTTEDTLLQNVQKCWASLFTPRAIFYRFEKGMHGSKISVAVVVQKMVQSEVSGIAFSVHPVTEDYNQLIIEGGFGLGEAIVSGQVTPDSFVVEKQPRRIIDKNITFQSRALWRAESGGNEWRELSQTEGNKPALSDDQVLELSKIVLNIENQYGFPCDIEWAFEAGKFYITQSRPITTLSAAPKRDAPEEKTASSAQDEWYDWGRFPSRMLYHSLWLHYNNTPVTKETPELRMEEFQVLDHNYYFKTRDLDRICDFVAHSFEQNPFWFDAFFKQCEARLHAVRALDTNASFADFFDVVRPALSQSFAIELLDFGVQKYVSARAPNPDAIFHAVSPKKRTLLGEFNYQVGRGAEASELLPEYEWVGTHGFSGEGLTKDRVDQFKRSSHGDSPDVSVPPLFAKVVEVASELAFWRSNIVETVDMLSYRRWGALKVLGAVHGLDWSQMVEMTAEEVCELEKGIVPQVDTLERSKRFGLIVSGSSYRIVTGDELGRAIMPHQKDIGVPTDHVSGRSAFPGVVRGVVRIIHSSTEIGKMNDGDILIADETQPDFIIGMKKAAAIVTNNGGITSHAALLSRELRVPCVVGTKIATRVFKDGDMVEVDADNGGVRLIERPISPFLALDPTEYRYFGYYRSLPLAMWFWNSWYIEALAQKVGMASVVAPGYLMIADGHTLVPEKTIESFDVYIKDKIATEGLVYFDSLAATAKDEYLQAAAWAETVNVNSGDLVGLYAQFVERLRRIMFFWASGWLRSQVFGKLLEQNAVEAGIDAADVPSYVSQPDTPMLSLQKELRALKETLEAKGIWDHLKIDPSAALQMIESDTSVSAVIKKHLKAYDWIQILNLVGEPLTTEGLLAQISYLKPGHMEAKKEAPGDFALYAQIASRVSYVHQAGAEYYSMVSRAMFPVLEAIQEKAGITRDELLLLFPEELFVDGALAPNIREVIARRAGANYALLTDGNGTALITDDRTTVQDLLEKFIPKPETSNAGEIKGQRGNKGKATGTVRVIMATDDFHKMQDGDVLVTPMTTPDFVILMQRASAIVTDMGGLLCHAAIVSRELGKPCVIDTKFATQLLKDGDMVEVDADKGIVRLLNSSAVQRSALSKAKSIDWVQDWSGLYTLTEAWLDNQAGTGTYFDSCVKAFGRGFSKMLITYQGETATGWVESSEYEQFGTYLAARAQNDSVRKQWLNEYRNRADRLKELLSLPHESFLKHLSEFKKIYPEYGPYVICTKIAFSFLPPGTEAVGAELEDARKYTEQIYKISAKLFNELSQAISEKSGIDIACIRTLNIEELEEYAHSQTLPDESILRERASAGAVYAEPGNVQLLSRSETDELVRSWQAGMNESELKGVVAYPGLVRGVCKVLRSYKNASIQEGEILVTTMTDPNFLPLMHTCAAIVTDGGGMLSHAAIVARELKKPCVIGTKFATSVLKDGDMVEVDAENGIVRKI